MNNNPVVTIRAWGHHKNNTPQFNPLECLFSTKLKAKPQIIIEVINKIEKISPTGRSVTLPCDLVGLMLRFLVLLAYSALSTAYSFQMIKLIRLYPSNKGRALNLLTTSSRNLRKHMASTSDEVMDIPDVLPQKFESLFLKTMLDRGFIHQCTDFKSLDEKFVKELVPAYLGFDATASSLHVGSLLQIMILRHLQKCGHKPIILIGGGTTKVGDPTGKDESRQLLSEETIKNNADGIAQVFKKFIAFGNGPTDAIMVNNADWLDSIKYLEFLRDYGRYFTINR